MLKLNESPAIHEIYNFALKCGMAITVGAGVTMRDDNVATTLGCVDSDSEGIDPSFVVLECVVAEIMILEAQIF